MTPAWLHPVRLRCAHLDNPLGVAPGRVRFGWQLPDTGGDCAQTAFQIQVFPNESLRLSSGTPSWDSGRVASGECLDIPYAGVALTPGGRYWWRVRVWDGASDAVSGLERRRAGSRSSWTRRTAGMASWIGLGPVSGRSFTPPTG